MCDPSGFEQSPPNDHEDPYPNMELDDLPDWWRRNIETFRKHRMRPYRPPQFIDGDIVTEVVDGLERELNVDITISKRVDGNDEKQWQIRVDGTPIASVERIRDKKGRSVYSIRRKVFESAVRSAL